MLNEQSIMDRLAEKNRVDVTPKNYFKSINTCLIILAIVLISVVGSGLYVAEITFLNLAIAGFLIVFFGFLGYRFKRNTNSIAIKGDTLILNAPGRPSCVTSIRAISNVQTNSVLGLQMTKLRYNLDGRTRSIKVINRASSVVYSPEQLLKKAMELSKKQKANHKPGSVLAN